MIPYFEIPKLRARNRNLLLRLKADAEACGGRSDLGGDIPYWYSIRLVIQGSIDEDELFRIGQRLGMGRLREQLGWEPVLRKRWKLFDEYTEPSRLIKKLQGKVPGFKWELSGPDTAILTLNPKSWSAQEFGMSIQAENIHVRQVQLRLWEWWIEEWNRGWAGATASRQGRSWRRLDSLNDPYTVEMADLTPSTSPPTGYPELPVLWLIQPENLTEEDLDGAYD